MKYARHHFLVSTSLIDRGSGSAPSDYLTLTTHKRVATSIDAARLSNTELDGSLDSQRRIWDEDSQIHFGRIVKTDRDGMLDEVFLLAKLCLELEKWGESLNLHVPWLYDEFLVPLRTCEAVDWRDFSERIISWFQSFAGFWVLGYETRVSAACLASARRLGFTSFWDPESMTESEFRILARAKNLRRVGQHVFEVRKLATTAGLVKSPRKDSCVGYAMLAERNVNRTSLRHLGAMSGRSHQAVKLALISASKEVGVSVFGMNAATQL